MDIHSYTFKNLVTLATASAQDLYHLNNRAKHAHEKWPVWMTKILVKKSTAPAGIVFLADKAEQEGFVPNSLEKNLILSFVGNGEKEQLEKSGWRFKKSLTEVREDELSRFCEETIGCGLAGVQRTYNPVYERDYTNDDIVRGYINMFCPATMIPLVKLHVELPESKHDSITRLVVQMHLAKLKVPESCRTQFRKFISIDGDGLITALTPEPAAPVEISKTVEAPPDVKKNENESPAPSPCEPVIAETVPEIQTLTGVTANYIITEQAVTTTAF